MSENKEILCPVCEHKLEMLSEMIVTMYRCANQDCSEKNKMSNWNILEKRRLFIQSRIDRAVEEAVRKERLKSYGDGWNDCWRKLHGFNKPSDNIPEEELLP